MTWNYRVMRHYEDDEDDTWDAIHEVYYFKDGTMNWTTEPASPLFVPAYDEVSFSDIIALFMEATDKPILNYDDGKEIEE